MSFESVMSYSQTRRTLRVLTANLFADRLDVQGFRGVLEEVKPDVAVVQELSFEAAEVLAEVLPHGMLNPALNTLGQGVALRSPGAVRRYRRTLIAELRPPDWPDSVEILNVHMPNPIMWPPWRSVRARGRLLDSLLRYMASPGRRLVAGDFNASPAWPVYRQMARRLEDAALMVARAKGQRPERTWGPTPGSPRLLRIDHVFVEGITPVDARVVPLPGSDHSGVLVDIAVAPGTEGPVV